MRSRKLERSRRHVEPARLSSLRQQRTGKDRAIALIFRSSPSGILLALHGGVRRGRLSIEALTHTAEWEDDMRHRTLIVMVALLLAPFGGGLVSSEAAAIDQRQLIIDSSPSTGSLAIGGSSEQKLAQVVTAGVSGFLTAVRLPVLCGATGTLNVEIQAVDEDKPNGVVLTSESVSASSLPFAGATFKT